MQRNVTTDDASIGRARVMVRTLQLFVDRSSTAFGGPKDEVEP
jgi:hypothetical protein